MPPIELGISQEEMRDLSIIKPVPDGTYEFVVDHIDYLNLDDQGDQIDSSKRPGMVWWLKIINNPAYPNKMLRYYTPLSWRTPHGEIETSGIGFLNDILTVLKVSLQGSQLPDREFFYGKGGVLKTTQKPRSNDPELIDNVIKMIVPKKGTVS
jgi:hypothetical protein